MNGYKLCYWCINQPCLQGVFILARCLHVLWPSCTFWCFRSTRYSVSLQCPNDILSMAMHTSHESINTRIWRCKFWRYLDSGPGKCLAVMFWCVANVWLKFPKHQLNPWISVSLWSFERIKCCYIICLIWTMQVFRGNRQRMCNHKKKLSGISMIAQSAVLNLVTLVTLVLHQLLHTHICSITYIIKIRIKTPQVCYKLLLQPRAELNHKKGRKLVGLPVCWVKNYKLLL